MMLVTWARCPLSAKSGDAASSPIALSGGLVLASTLAIALIGSVAAWAQSPASADRRPDGQLAQMSVGGPRTPSGEDAATGRAWRVVSVEGRAHVLVDDGQSIGWHPLSAGQELPGDSQIETGPGSQVLLFNGRDAITVGAETRLGLVQTEVDANEVEIFQDSGTAEHPVIYRGAEGGRARLTGGTVLKPGAFFALSEHGLGPANNPYHPVPWSADGSGEYLVTPDETRAFLDEAGFTEIRIEFTGPGYLAGYRRAIDLAEQGRLPALGVHILLGEQSLQIVRNAARNIEQDRTCPIQVICRKPGANA